MFNKLILEKEYTDALELLLTRITTETRARLVADGLDCPANMQNAEARISSGRQFDKIVIGNGVRYFVERLSGTVYASASRNAPNFNRSFGTVYSQDDFNWGAYEARAKPGTPWEMRPTRGGYFTAVPK